MKKSKKIEFSNLKYLLFGGIFLSGIGGYSPPPLTDNHCAHKSLAETGVPAPPPPGPNRANCDSQVVNAMNRKKTEELLKELKIKHQ